MSPTPVQIKPDGLAGGDGYLYARVGQSWFSYTRKGDAIMFHVKSEDPRSLRKAAELFIEWAFSEYKWCKMIIVTINRGSLKRLAHRLGFREFFASGDISAMMRVR